MIDFYSVMVSSLYFRLERRDCLCLFDDLIIIILGMMARLELGLNYILN
jgi:hypothetical protein